MRDVGLGVSLSSNSMPSPEKYFIKLLRYALITGYLACVLQSNFIPLLVVSVLFGLPLLGHEYYHNNQCVSCKRCQNSCFNSWQFLQTNEEINDASAYTTGYSRDTAAFEKLFK